MLETTRLGFYIKFSGYAKVIAVKHRQRLSNRRSLQVDTSFSPVRNFAECETLVIGVVRSLERLWTSIAVCVAMQFIRRLVNSLCQRWEKDTIHGPQAQVGNPY
jgi:hypothetical protein